MNVSGSNFAAKRLAFGQQAGHSQKFQGLQSPSTAVKFGFNSNGMNTTGIMEDDETTRKPKGIIGRLKRLFS